MTQEGASVFFGRKKKRQEIANEVCANVRLLMDVTFSEFGLPFDDFCQDPYLLGFLYGYMHGQFKLREHFGDAPLSNLDKGLVIFDVLVAISFKRESAEAVTRLSTSLGDSKNTIFVDAFNNGLKIVFSGVDKENFLNDAELKQALKISTQRKNAKISEMTGWDPVIAALFDMFWFNKFEKFGKRRKKRKSNKCE